MKNRNKQISSVRTKDILMLMLFTDLWCEIGRQPYQRGVLWSVSGLPPGSGLLRISPRSPVSPLLKVGSRCSRKTRGSLPPLPPPPGHHLVISSTHTRRLLIVEANVCRPSQASGRAPNTIIGDFWFIAQNYRLQIPWVISALRLTRY